MLNLAYIKRESSGQLSKLYSLPLFFFFFLLIFWMWEMTPSSGAEILGGISAGGKEWGNAFAF